MSPTLQSGMALENGKFSIIMPLSYNYGHYQWRIHGGMQMQMQMQMQMRMSAGLDCGWLLWVLALLTSLLHGVYILEEEEEENL